MLVAVPASDGEDRDRPRTSSVVGDDRDGGPAVAEQAVERQQRPEDDEDPELHELDDVPALALEVAGGCPAGGSRA